MNEAVWNGESERGKLEIKSLGHAIQCVIATSISRMHDDEGLKEDKQLQELMSTFGLKNDNFICDVADDPSDFPYIWHYAGMVI